MSHRRRFSWTALAALALVAAAVSAPRASADGPKDWRAAAAKVDGLVASKFRAQKDLVVAPLADDAEYLRRVTMDLTGTIPTYDETVSFLQDTAPDKRSARLASG